MRLNVERLTCRAEAPSARSLMWALLFVLLMAPSARGQGAASSSISGVVKDTGGGVVPGASIVVTSNATGTKFETVTNTTGAYAVPALPAGTYSVTVSLQGFKTAVITDVRVQLSIPTTVNATLDVGNLVETVTVTGASAELINTQTPAVAATLNVEQIAAIPTPTRNALNAVTFLVGVNTSGSARVPPELVTISVRGTAAARCPAAGTDRR